MAKKTTQASRRDETPMMKQYDQVKAQHPEALLLFRVGDFYEAFYEDAHKISSALNIVLTRRANGSAKDVPMAGFPHHAMDTYLAKLVQKGFRVAICEQMEDPKMAKGVVKREVTDIVTPGVNFNDRILDEKRNNYLCALHFSKQQKHATYVGVAFIDVTTAEFQVTRVFESDLKDLLHAIQPSELLISKAHKDKKEALQPMVGSHVIISTMEEWIYTEEYARQTMLGHFKTHSLKGFGIDELEEGIIAAAAILTYIEETQRGKLAYVASISRFDTDMHMVLDSQTKRNLEIVFSLHSGNRDGTLVEVIDQTQTAMGARLLKKWVSRPSRVRQVVQNRLDAVEELLAHETLAERLNSCLKAICDIERVLSRIATGRANPREILQLNQSLESIGDIQEVLSQASSEELLEIGNTLALCPELIEKIHQAVDPDAPVSVGEGHTIRKGFNEELDELKNLAFSAKDQLKQIQTRERERTGISTLKVQFNKVFGYYIEIGKVHASKVPGEYEKKQTLVNAERYTIPVLKEYEVKILNAQERIGILEHELFDGLCRFISGYAEELQTNARAIAALDCLCSYAEVSEQNNFTKPDIHEEYSLAIRKGRHPVLEKLLPADEAYVPNDCYFNDQKHFMIITGPNMSGKSSYLRQIGLIVLLAQAGCFVPAEHASIGLVDKIFTRVGASDNLTAGESTFLVEMNEAANILHNATENSLILLDEIGRGTSTFDGMSIAWAISEYIHNRIGAKTLFATHYHELADLEGQLEFLANYNAMVEEIDDQVIFLRTIEKGASDNSYGIEVARMAGLPAEVVERAKDILVELETPSTQGKKHKKPGIKAKSVSSNQLDYQLSLYELGDRELKEALIKIDVNKLTPIEALLKLSELKSIAEKSF